ncbi:MAG: LysE family translocator [Paracoccaceae bacterium]
MPTLHSLVSVALAGLALSATPGPSMLYVLSQSVGQSRAAGLASAVGLCLGGILLAVATALGLATVFANAAWLVVALRYVGSVYLVWLGTDLIRKARMNAKLDLTASKISRTPMLSILWQGVLVELLNPKTVLFFALFLPPFVAMGHGQTEGENLTIQLLVLGSLVPLTALPADIFVALMGSAMTRTLNGNKTAREFLAWLGGLLLIGIAVSLHLKSF